MLQLSSPPPIAAQFMGSEQYPSARQMTVADFLNGLRRQWLTIAGSLVVALGLGLIYFFTAPSVYTSSTRLMIDSRRSQHFSPQQSILAEGILDSTGVESQIEVLRSDSTAFGVIDKLDLTNDPGLLAGRPSLLNAISNMVFGLFDSPSASSASDVRQWAFQTLNSNLAVDRIGVTNVIQISYRSQDPAKAAQIANAFAATYMERELQAKYQVAKHAGTWLQDRIAELREQTSAADHAVQQFKAEHNLVGTGRGSVTEQQLSEVNTQLVLARAHSAEAKARLDQVVKLSVGNVPEAATTEALKDSVITHLRQQLLDLSQREADLLSRNGADHPAVLSIRNSIRDTNKSLTDELHRISEGYKSDYEIASARQNALQEGLADLIKSSATANQAEVRLRELESSAQSYKALFDTLLRKYMEAVEQQSFPITDARIISPAFPPVKKSDPRGSVILGVASVLGLCAGLAISFVREALHTGLRTPSEVQSHLRVECFGAIPIIAAVSNPREKLNKGLGTSDRMINITRSVLSFATQDRRPQSTETIRRIKTATDMVSPKAEAKIIGVVSASTNEGKTTIAANLAQLTADTGARVLLVDLNLRDAMLSRLLAPNATNGLLEVLAETLNLERVVWRDPVTHMEFLPAIIGKKLAHTAEIISSPSMARFLKFVQKSYDYVILDLPALTPFVDATVASRLVDGFVLVVESGRTSGVAIVEALETAGSVRSKLLGAVLNKAKFV